MTRVWFITGCQKRNLYYGWLSGSWSCPVGPTVTCLEAQVNETWSTWEETIIPRVGFKCETPVFQQRKKARLLWKQAMKVLEETSRERSKEKKKQTQGHMTKWLNSELKQEVEMKQMKIKETRGKRYLCKVKLCKFIWNWNGKSNFGAEWRSLPSVQQQLQR